MTNANDTVSNMAIVLLGVEDTVCPRREDRRLRLTIMMQLQTSIAPLGITMAYQGNIEMAYICSVSDFTTVSTTE